MISYFLKENLDRPIILDLLYNLYPFPNRLRGISTLEFVTSYVISIVGL